MKYTLLAPRTNWLTDCEQHLRRWGSTLHLTWKRVSPGLKGAHAYEESERTVSPPQLPHSYVACAWVLNLVNYGYMP